MTTTTADTALQTTNAEARAAELAAAKAKQAAEEQHQLLALIEWRQSGPAVDGAVIKTMSDAWRLCSALSSSGYFPDSRGAAQAFVKVQAGAELGFPAFASMQGFYLNDKSGRLGRFAQLELAHILKRGGRFRILQNDHKGCKIQWLRNDWIKAGEYEVVGESSFDHADAAQAGLDGKDTYKKYARDLFFDRAVTRGRKQYFSDYFNGTGHDVLEETLDDGDVVTYRRDANGEQQQQTTGPDVAPKPRKGKSGSDKLKEAAQDAVVVANDPTLDEVEAAAKKPAAPSSTTPTASADNKPATPPGSPTSQPSQPATPGATPASPPPPSSSPAGSTEAPRSAPSSAAATPAQATATTAAAATSTTAAAPASVAATSQADPSPASSLPSAATNTAPVEPSSQPPSSTPALAPSSSTSTPANESAPASSPASSPPPTLTADGAASAPSSAPPSSTSESEEDAQKPHANEATVVDAVRRLPVKREDLLTRHYNLWSDLVTKSGGPEADEMLKMCIRRSFSVLKKNAGEFTIDEWRGIPADKRDAVRAALVAGGVWVEAVKIDDATGEPIKP